MKSFMLRFFAFFCLMYAKCIAFSVETTDNLFLSLDEMKELVFQEFEFIEPSKKSLITFKSSYAPGRDALSQGGCAVHYYLAPYLSLKTGPSYCRDIGIKSKWKWACQLHCEVPFYR